MNTKNALCRAVKKVGVLTENNFGGNEMISGVVIEFPSGGKLRVRDCVSRSKARVTYKHPGFKSGRMHQLESHLEERAFCLHDANSSVSEINEQYAKISYFCHGELKTHYPDLYIRTNVRKVFKEVKTDDAANDQEIIDRTEVLSKLLPIYGFEYELLTESEINKEPRLSNCKFLLRHGRTCVSLCEVERVRKFIIEFDGLSWGQVMSNVFGKHSLSIICNMILRGYCMIDINSHWNDETQITFFNRFNIKGVI